MSDVRAVRLVYPDGLWELGCANKVYVVPEEKATHALVPWGEWEEIHYTLTDSLEAPEEVWRDEARKVLRELFMEDM